MLYDATGQSIKSIRRLHEVNVTQQLDMIDLPSGLYWLVLLDEDEKMIGRQAVVKMD